MDASTPDSVASSIIATHENLKINSWYKRMWRWPRGNKNDGIIEMLEKCRFKPVTKC